MSFPSLMEDSRDGLGQPAFCGVAVMAKASKAGRTKTRLTPPLTPDEAALFNTAFLGDIAGNLIAAGKEAALAGYMAYGPPGEHGFFGFLPASIGLFEAWDPDFGACLSGAIATLLAAGHGAACVLNADSPTLPPAFLIEAARVLAAPGDRAVLGPSTDGGYYLLGLKQNHARLFQEIDWSTERVAGQTLARAQEIGLPVHVLPTWYDVDDADALRVLRGELLQGRPFSEGVVRAEARHSLALIQRLEREAGLASRLADKSDSLDLGPMGPQGARPAPADRAYAALERTAG